MGDVTITMNSGADKDMDKSLRRALKMIGMQAETYAKMLTPVDTGLLRNSITYAIGGEAPRITQYSDDAHQQEGAYSETAPKDEKSEITLYVGTNVHYAIYQELGHHTVSGGWVDPQPFLRPALENHATEYEQIFKREAK